MHYDSNYPITVSKSDSISSFSSEGKGVSGLVFWIGFGVSDSLVVFLSGDSLESFELDDSDFGLDCCRSGFLFVEFRFFDGRRSVGFVVRGLDIGNVLDLILMLNGISLRQDGRYSSVLYFFVDFLAL